MKKDQKKRIIDRPYNNKLVTAMNPSDKSARSSSDGETTHTHDDRARSGSDSVNEGLCNDAESLLENENAVSVFSPQGAELENLLLPYFQTISEEIDPAYFWNVIKVVLNLVAQCSVILAIEDAVAENNSLLETISTLTVNLFLNYFVAQPGINDCVDAFRGVGKAPWSFSTLLRLLISILPSLNYVEIPMENPGLMEGVPKAWLWLFLVPFAIFSWRASKSIIANVEKLIQPLNVWDVYTDDNAKLIKRIEKAFYEYKRNQLFDIYIAERNERMVGVVAEALIPLVKPSSNITEVDIDTFFKTLNSHVRDVSLPSHDANSKTQSKTHYLLTFVLGTLCTISYLGYMAETSQSFEKQGEKGTFYQLCALAAIASTTVLSFIVGGNISNVMTYALKENHWRSSFLYKYVLRLTGVSVPLWVVLAGFSAGLATALTENYLSKNIFLLVLDVVGTIVFNTYPFPELLYTCAISWFMSSALNKINQYMQQHSSVERVSLDEEKSVRLEEGLLHYNEQGRFGELDLTKAEKEALYLNYLSTFRDMMNMMPLEEQRSVIQAVMGEMQGPDGMSTLDAKRALGIPSEKQWALNVSIFMINAAMAFLCFSHVSDTMDFSKERCLYMGIAAVLNLLAYKVGERLVANANVVEHALHRETDIGQELSSMSIEDNEVLGSPVDASSFSSLNTIERHEVTLFGRITKAVKPVCAATLPMVAGAVSLWGTELAARYFKGVLAEMPQAYVTVPVCAFVAMHFLPQVSEEDVGPSLSMATP